jgi:hypothetical protein
MNLFLTIIRYSIKARKQLLLLLLFLVQTAVVAAGLNGGRGTKSSKYDYLLKINSSAIAVVDSNVVVSLQMTALQDVPTAQSVILSPELIDTTTNRQVDFPLIFINSRNQHIYYNRELKDEYPDAMELLKKRGKDLKIDYLRSVKYEPWMKNAVLKIRKLSCACNRKKDRGEEFLDGFEKVKPEIKLFPVYLLPPADKRGKVREEKGSAYLCYVVNKWDILPNYMDNPVELQKIFNSVNFVKSDSDVTINRMVIEGFASPEGACSHNVMLSEKRTQALKDYLKKTGIARDVRMVASGKGENWSGFLEYLNKNYDVPQRSLLLKIAKSSISEDEKERRMRAEAPQGYRYCIDNVFPSLRCTNYTVVYTVRPFSLEESERIFETRPINLSLNEIYRLADKYANNEKKYYEIIRKAYLLYPNDSYINLTMAYLAIKKREADEAAEYLSKVKDCPEKKLNEGLVAYLKGDTGKALKLVEQAQKQGVSQATLQLNEFRNQDVK